MPISTDPYGTLTRTSPAALEGRNLEGWFRSVSQTTTIYFVVKVQIGLALDELGWNGQMGA